MPAVSSTLPAIYILGRIACCEQGRHRLSTWPFSQRPGVSRALAHADATVAYVRLGVDPGSAGRLFGTELAVPGVLALIPADSTALTEIAVPTVAAMNDGLVGHEVLVHVPRAHVSIVGAQLRSS